MKFSEKSKAAFIAVITATGLFLIKLVVGWFTGALSVIASSLDSAMDAIASSMAFLAINVSEKPPDKEHPFGHGKVEAIASLFQAILISVLGMYIIYSSIHRMIDGYILISETSAIVVMAFSILVSLILTKKLQRASRKTDSLALKADSLHYATDAWIGLGVIVALVLEKYMHVSNADALISLLISVYVIISALQIFKEALTQLMDKALPEKTLQIIKNCVSMHSSEIKGYHRLKTRSSGSLKLIEFHLEIDKHMSFKAAHDLTEEVVSKIESEIPNSEVIIHSDPV